MCATTLKIPGKLRGVGQYGGVFRNPNGCSGAQRCAICKSRDLNLFTHFSIISTLTQFKDQNTK